MYNHHSLHHTSFKHIPFSSTTPLSHSHYSITIILPNTHSSFHSHSITIPITTQQHTPIPFTNTQPFSPFNINNLKYTGWMGRRYPTLHNQTNTHHTHSSSLLQLLSSLIPLSHLSTISPFHSTNSFTLVYFTNRGQLILRVHITNIHSTHSSFIPVAGDHSSLLLIQSLSFYQTLNIPIHFHSISFIK